MNRKRKIIYAIITISLLLLVLIICGCCDSTQTKSQLLPVKEYTINEDGTVKCITNTSKDNILYFPVNQIYWHNGSTVVIQVTYKKEPKDIISRSLYINKQEYDKYYKNIKSEAITVKDR